VKLAIELLGIWIASALPCMVICGRLASEKGRNPGTYTVLAAIPVFNLFFLLYVVGAPSRRLEGKIDKLLADLSSRAT
jgi:hypothetical protein